MREVLPNACFIAFTGTPIAKKEKSTFAKFGELVQPSYSMRDAVGDKAVVPLLYEGREVVTDVDEGQIDRWFEVHTRVLSDDQRADLKRKMSRAREVEGIDDQAHYRRLLIAFYTITARHVFAERLDAVIPPFIRKGLKKPSLVIRQMSKRWGSYTPKGKIVLNVDLIRASPMLIDYVICHELAHAFFPDHGKEWRNLFDTIMPDWEDRKQRLETSLR